MTDLLERSFVGWGFVGDFFVGGPPPVVVPVTGIGCCSAADGVVTSVAITDSAVITEITDVLAFGAGALDELGFAAPVSDVALDLPVTTDTGTNAVSVHDFLVDSVSTSDVGLQLLTTDDELLEVINVDDELGLLISVKDIDLLGVIVTDTNSGTSTTATDEGCD